MNKRYEIYSIDMCFNIISLYKFLSIVFLHQSQFIFLFLYYFIYCNRLFYSHLAFLARDED